MSLFSSLKTSIKTNIESALNLAFLIHSGLRLNVVKWTLPRDQRTSSRIFSSREHTHIRHLHTEIWFCGSKCIKLGIIFGTADWCCCRVALNRFFKVIFIRQNRNNVGLSEWCSWLGAKSLGPQILIWTCEFTRKGFFPFFSKQICTTCWGVPCWVCAFECIERIVLAKTVLLALQE